MSKQAMKEHEKYVSRARERGDPLIDYNCPRCDFLIAARVPRKGVEYDSMVQCPSCDELHVRCTPHSGAPVIRVVEQRHA